MRSLLLLQFLFICSFSFGQTPTFWKKINDSRVPTLKSSNRLIIPEKYDTYHLDLPQLATFLQNAVSQSSENNSLIIHLPIPDYEELIAFEVSPSAVMMPGLAAKYPMIKSFSGQGVDDNRLKARIDCSPYGFHAVVYTPAGEVYIDPYAKNENGYYISYFTRDYSAKERMHTFSCGTTSDSNAQTPLVQSRENAARTATQVTETQVEMRTYRLALACTGQYAEYHGGTVEQTLAAMVTLVNRITGILEREAAIRLTLIDNNDEIIFLDADTDGYTNGSPGDLLSENAGIINPIIGSSNYDIGHVLGTNSGFGGVASLQSVCSPAKAAASSTMNDPIADPFVVDIVSHEVGHQFGGNHSFSSCHNVNATTSWEPGGGTTIMSYSGICGDEINNLQEFSDDYFHSGSLGEIILFSRLLVGNSCPEIEVTENHEPIAEIPLSEGFYVPKGTPFELTGIGTDMDNDALTYCWEQIDVDAQNINSVPGSPQGNSPLFRSFPPSDSPMRVFPKIESIISNSNSVAEVLPNYGRDLNFRFTVRDNNPLGGGTVWEDIEFFVAENSGPFRVTYPNSIDTFEVGEYLDVTWDVASTDTSIVNCKSVNIKLSVDGGFTFPISLATNVPNSGNRMVYIPNQITSDARIRIEAADNIFFDISNQNFEIIPASTPSFALDPTPYVQSVCSPDEAIIDLNMISTLGYDSLVQIEVTDLPEGVEVAYSANPVSPIESGSIIISTENFPEEGLAPVTITSISSSQDTLSWTVYLDIIFNDLSAITPLEPANGSSAVEEVPTFMWTPSPNANSYEIQIADNPSFSPESLIEYAQGVIGSSFLPSTQLDANTLYFWRLRPLNECGFGDYSAPQGFHTEIFTCNTFVSNDVPVNISGVGTPTVESILEIESDITINDLNISKIRGSHDLVQHLDVSLISPDETEVLLFSGECGVSTSFNMKLDDEAPEGPITCFNGNFQPEGMLSDFDGSSSVGNWILKAAVNNPDGTGGSLQEWSLELCSNASASPPFLVNNQTLPVAPGEGRIITDDFLLSQDNNNSPAELRYTVVTAPEFGTLYFQNEPVEVGMTFRQSSLNAGNVKYVNDDASATTDGFTFAVEDGEGGWFGTPLFEIMMDESAPVNTEELLNKNSFTIFPNPAQDQLNLQFKQAFNGRMDVRLTNVQGQLLQNQRFDNVLEQIQLNTSNLTSGIYFIFVDTDFGTATKKVVIQR